MRLHHTHIMQRQELLCNPPPYVILSHTLYIRPTAMLIILLKLILWLLGFKIKNTCTQILADVDDPVLLTGS